MSHWAPEVWEVAKFRVSGIGDMGTVSDLTTGPRFSMPVDYVLIYLRAWFGSGTGSATMSLKQFIPGEPSLLFNQPVRKFDAIGTGGDVFVDFRVQMDELQHWGFAGGTELVPEWTNPDSGTMTWAVECGLAPMPTPEAR